MVGLGGLNQRPRPYQLSTGRLRRVPTSNETLRFASVYAASVRIGLCYVLRPLAANVDLCVHQIVHQLPADLEAPKNPYPACVGLCVRTNFLKIVTLRTPVTK
jgi:hypothetical protein